MEDEDSGRPRLQCARVDDGCVPDCDPVVRRRNAGEAAGRYRYLAAASRRQAVHRTSPAALFRWLGPAVRTVDELEAAHRAAQYRRVHAGAGRRPPELYAAEAGAL